MAHAADNITLTETGSTLLYPLFQSWIAGYKSVAPNIDLSAAATGSGAGEQGRARGHGQHRRLRCLSLRRDRGA